MCLAPAPISKSCKQRLYEPDTGCVAIGPHVLRSTDVHHLRDHVAVVSQQPHLFDASIAENIAYGARGLLAPSEIVSAARAAHAHEFIAGLPQGYETLVGENAALNFNPSSLTGVQNGDTITFHLCVLLLQPLS